MHCAKAVLAAAPQEARRHHRGVLLRRQSRHGVVVRQAGAARRRRRSQAQVHGAADRARSGAARQARPASKASTSPSATPSAPDAEAARSLRQHLVGRGLPLRRHAAGRARLGHAREVGADERHQAQVRLPGGNLPDAARAPTRGCAHGRRPPRRNTAFWSRTTSRSRSRTTSRCATTGKVVYRPTCHYAYHPCNDAVLSLHELFGQAGERQPAIHILDEHEIVDGIDELGVLLYGHEKNAYWYGSQLSIEETRELAPYQNATGLQVTSAVLAGMVWALENPNARHCRSRRDGFPPLPRSADALSRAGDRHATPTGRRSRIGPVCSQEDIDKRDPWQFSNVLVERNRPLANAGARRKRRSF